MISYNRFKEVCRDRLRKELDSFDKDEVEEYVLGDEFGEVTKKFYDLGVKRFEEGEKKSNKIAFGYCVDTAVENLRMMF